MWGHFTVNFFPCDLRKGSTLYLPMAHSARHEINLFQFRGGLLWNNLPRETK